MQILGIRDSYMYMCRFVGLKVKVLRILWPTWSIISNVECNNNYKKLRHWCENRAYKQDWFLEWISVCSDRACKTLAPSPSWWHPSQFWPKIQISNKAILWQSNAQPQIHKEPITILHQIKDECVCVCECTSLIIIINIHTSNEKRELQLILTS